MQLIVPFRDKKVAKTSMTNTVFGKQINNEKLLPPMMDK